MEKIRLLAIFLLVLVCMTACSALLPEPTPTQLPVITNPPLPSATPIPTSAPTAIPTITSTAYPTDTSSPAPTDDFLVTLMPEGQPAAEWQGIPIMPGAVAGEGDSLGYTFAIDAARREIEAFYQQQLTNLGWEYLSSGTNDAGQISMLIFIKGEEVTGISIFDGPDNLILVMIVK